MSKFIEITDDPKTLPDFGVRVLGCTVRKTPPPTKLVYDAYDAAGFNVEGRNNMLSMTLQGHDHPQKVLEHIAKSGHVQEFTRSALLEMYRLRAEDRVQGQQKIRGAWGWVSDAMPISAEFDTTPTHWMPAPVFEP